MNTTSTGRPRIGSPGVRAMYSSARSRARREPASGWSSGDGIRPVIGMPMPGVGPVGDHRLEGTGIDRWPTGRRTRRRRSAARASEPRPRPTPRRAGRTAGRPRTRTSCRPARPARPGPRPRCSCCRSVIRCSIVSARIASPRVLEDVTGPAADPDPGDEREDDVLGPDARRQPARRPGPRRSSAGAGAGTGWPGPSRPRSSRSRRRAPRTRRGSRCASRRRRSSSRAGSGRARVR